MTATTMRGPSLPVLELSGPALRDGLDGLLEAAAPAGGVTPLLDALRVKTGVFAELLGGGRVQGLEEVPFLGLVNFMPTVRRRIGAWLDVHGFAVLRARLEALLAEPGPVEARRGRFLAAFPADRAHRWVRDLAAELLHFTAPEAVPLTTRWMWDAGTGTGVLREIWYAGAGGSDTPEVSDDLPTFLALGAELDLFLREHGMFRDLALMQDVLCAHIYAGYINDRGGTYLKGDFSGGEDKLAHTRRMLGIDVLTEEGLRPRVKLPASVMTAPGAFLSSGC